MYPVNPVSKETIGRTEEIIGNWIAANPARRGDFILATKHSGEGMAHVRGGAPISAATIAQTIEGNLRRLKPITLIFISFIGWKPRILCSAKTTTMNRGQQPQRGCRQYA